jgi:hypothetical protein
MTTAVRNALASRLTAASARSLSFHLGGRERHEQAENDAERRQHARGHGLEGLGPPADRKRDDHEVD